MHDKLWVIYHVYEGTKCSVAINKFLTCEIFLCVFTCTNSSPARIFARLEEVLWQVAMVLGRGHGVAGVERGRGWGVHRVTSTISSTPKTGMVEN